MTVGDFLENQGISGLIGGVLAAVATHLLTKRRTEAEIVKLQAEAELIRAQAKTLEQKLADTERKLTEDVSKVSYAVPNVSDTGQTILYTSGPDSESFDFKVAKVDRAEGELEINDGILNLRRSNTLGTMQIWLKSYRLDRKERLEILPKNEKISGDRKLHASCEVKAVGSEHTLLFILKGENTPHGEHLGETRQRVSGNEWVRMEGYFRLSPGMNCHFRIDDRSVSAPGSVQIRKLVLAERTS